MRILLAAIGALFLTSVCPGLSQGAPSSCPAADAFNNKIDEGERWFESRLRAENVSVESWVKNRHLSLGAETCPKLLPILKELAGRWQETIPLQIKGESCSRNSKGLTPTQYLEQINSTISDCNYILAGRDPEHVKAVQQFRDTRRQDDERRRQSGVPPSDGLMPRIGTTPQLLYGLTQPQCAARGGRIITYTNTAGRGPDVGECYVPPGITSGSVPSAQQRQPSPSSPIVFDLPNQTPQQSAAGIEPQSAPSRVASAPTAPLQSPPAADLPSISSGASRPSQPPVPQPQTTVCSGESQNPVSDITGTTDDDVDTPLKSAQSSNVDPQSAEYCKDAAKYLETARRSPQRHEKPAQDSYKQAAAAFKLAGDLPAANAALAEAANAMRAKQSWDRGVALQTSALGMEKGAMEDQTCARLDGLEQASAWYKDAMQAFVQAGASDRVKQLSEKIAFIEKYLKDNQLKCPGRVATAAPGSPPTAVPPPDNKCAGALANIKAVNRAGDDMGPLREVWAKAGCNVDSIVLQISRDCLRVSQDDTIDDNEKKRRMQEIGCRTDMSKLR